MCMLLLKIQLNYEAIIEHEPEHALFLFASFLDLSRKKTKSQNVPRTSLEAISDTREVSGAEIGRLTGNKIHFNMLTSNDFREQAFVRFKFPSDIHEFTDNQDAEAAQALVTTRNFLVIVCPRAREDVPQALFSLFMEKLVTRFNSSSDGKTDYAIASVTGMAPIDVEVTISEQYIIANAEMRYLLANAEMRDMWASNKRSRTQSTEDWNTTLTIKSDLVVFPISTDTDACPLSKRQRRQFIQCDVNLEMKRFRFLLENENKSSLTQVSAESYTRKSELPNPKVQYSVLTDCCGFYAFIHVVKPEDQSDEYWISRKESDPPKIVAILRWLLLRCRSTDPPDLSSWKEDTAQDQHSANAEQSANNAHAALNQESGGNVPNSNSASAGTRGEEENAGWRMFLRRTTILKTKVLIGPIFMRSRPNARLE
jgi:hypothetical protein